MMDGYYEGSPSSRVFTTPHRRDSLDVLWTSFHLPCAFIADPLHWASETRVVGVSQLRGTRPDEVLFPSQKAMLLNYDLLMLNADIEQVFRGTRAQGAFADGHAAIRQTRGSGVGPEMGDGGPPGSYDHYAGFPPWQHTHQGVRGRDVP